MDKELVLEIEEELEEEIIKGQKIKIAKEIDVLKNK